MKILKDQEEKEAIHYLNMAAGIARNSPCHRSKCGSIIVKDGIIIGGGFNGPPLGKRLDKCLKDDISKDFKSDRNCCVHAEQRAIIDALRRYPDTVVGSRLYFIRVDKDTNEILKAGEPYCTICSKMALDSGVMEFVLWHESGVTVYDTEEYNMLSFQYKE